ncbi:hypothetical protein ACM7KZ_13765 [Pseudomonas aeruginosa]|uniref:hypothetical protein n=1 Tax=Pseudomonas aeruginosa TaxID=287 RepID=UPI0012678621|nr:hypothetical protein [Pseudomonas aeruginosa]MBK3907687.1 hypothetical protein [Pseudomonas aeruginosa]
MGFSWWLKTGSTTPCRERIRPEGLNIENTGVVATRVRGGRCEADWIGQRGEPRCSLEDRGCQGMVLKNQRRMNTASRINLVTSR